MRKLIVLLATAIFSLALLPLGAGTAAAAPGGCTSGSLCVYRDINYNNGPWRFPGNEDNWHDWAIANNDSSWFNNGTSGRVAKVYRGVAWSGGVYKCMNRGQGFRAGITDDAGSSNYWGPERNCADV